MLICKNCFSENADGTIRCNQCNMEGNFIYKIPGGNKQDLLIGEKNKFHCPNCGSETPGEGPTCFYCHFPIAIAANRQPKVNSLNTREFKNFKTG